MGDVVLQRGAAAAAAPFRAMRVHVSVVVRARLRECVGACVLRWQIPE